MISKRTALAALAALAASAPAHAAVTISTAATRNMSCSNGTCVPTATKAVLNVGDLESYLSQFGNVRVMTTGNGVEANNIVVNAPFSSSDSTSLTLDAHGAITINAAVSIGSGTAELELQSDTLDVTYTLSFGKNGHITFGSLSDIFGINGGIFTLVGSVQGLASAVTANPSGAYALANSYDASQDGTYSTPPIPTTLAGIFEGLGNTITNLSIEDTKKNQSVGLFEEVASGGAINDLRLTKISVIGGKGTTVGGESVGGLVGVSNGTLKNDSVSGKVAAASINGNFPYSSAIGGIAGQSYGTIVDTESEGIVSGKGQDSSLGGLVGVNWGSIRTSRSTAKIEAKQIASDLGGLVGGNYGSIDQSFSTGNIETEGTAWIGGLVAFSCGSISNAYSTGTITSTDGGNSVGSVLGVNGSSIRGGSCTPGTVTKSYGVGLLTVGTQNFTWIGGFVGYDNASSGDLSSDYWDTDTTGVSDSSQGAGNVSNDPGITGVATQQLQSGLPAGFSRKIWAEDPSINNGLPYLINKPPPK